MAQNKTLLNVDKSGLAIQGFDPVAFFIDGKPVKGALAFESRYNGARYLRQAVDSILAQTFRDFEFLIVNDGSTDEETNRIIDRFTRPATRIITTANQGVAMARNTAIAQARGEYILPLDADDEGGGLAVLRDQNTFRLYRVQERQALLLELGCADRLHASIIGHLL